MAHLLSSRTKQEGGPTLAPALAQATAFRLGPKAFIPSWFSQRLGWPDLGLSLIFHLPTVRKRPGIWQHSLPTWGRVRLLATHLGVGERNRRLLVPAPPEGAGTKGTQMYTCRLSHHPSLAWGWGCGRRLPQLTEEKPDCCGLKFSPAHTGGAGLRGRSHEPNLQGRRATTGGGGCPGAFQFESERTLLFRSRPPIPQNACTALSSPHHSQKGITRGRKTVWTGDSDSRRAGTWDMPAVAS